MASFGPQWAPEKNGKQKMSMHTVGEASMTKRRCVSTCEELLLELINWSDWDSIEERQKKKKRKIEP